MRHLRRRGYATICAMTAIMLAGCARVSGGEYCSLYNPVYTSVMDSEETQAQVDLNNAVWMELCD